MTCGLKSYSNIYFKYATGLISGKPQAWTRDPFQTKENVPSAKYWNSAETRQRKLSSSNEKDPFQIPLEAPRCKREHGTSESLSLRPCPCDLRCNSFYTCHESLVLAFMRR